MNASFGETVRFIGRSAKRLAVAVVGGALVAVGLVMLVLPGPGVLVVALGFAVLATEFVWAHHVLEAGKRGARRVTDAARRAGRRAPRR
ncbi:MAG TPA: PGPGW domain-containing protein [Acidimicrobiales bacterium]|nr:PGPGW domain-containing protein [Acidimicrobiales bacterium]